MKIAIFSKFDMAGGSEFRCVELANGIGKYTEHSIFLLAEKRIPTKLLDYIDKDVNIIENCFLTPDYFYDADIIIVVNTDAREFSTLDYWVGKSKRHHFSIDIEKFNGKRLFFLYNFLVSPSRHLFQLSKIGADVGIITTNRKFFNEITKQDRYEFVRRLPRYILESPIDPSRLEVFVRNPKDKICFGMHSKRLDNKWNDEISRLIKDVNKRYSKGQVEFRFMGIKSGLRKEIGKIENVTCLKEDEESVRDFLSKIDVFLFFPSWKREEPWARVIAEAMVSGCPVIALDKGGTGDQILKYNNGFLCKRYKDYYQHILYLLEHKEQVSIMSKNSLLISRNFYTKKVVEKLLNIMAGDDFNGKH